MSEDTAGAEFARLLRELKDRSGLSYGTLAKRLHMSTSTLHRYCSGDVVPIEYAPVERLARLCKASPEELVELHRHWVLADANRPRRGTEPDVKSPAGAAPVAQAVAPTRAPQETGASVPREPGTPAPKVRHRRRAVIAGIAAAVVAVAVAGTIALTTNLPAGSTDARNGPTGATGATGATGTPSSAGLGGGTGSRAPLSVTTLPHTWESPCGQHYLIDKPPAQVSPPPVEQDAPAWVAASGAVPAGEQYVTLTIQGSGKETVVLDGLTVRMAAKRAPLAWNDYAMGYPGVGCGAGVPTRSFTVALDATRPSVVPEAGQPDFPFKVSESAPEVFYIKADASAYDVSWYLELTWSSGSRHGTLKIDNKGKPFRTSGHNGRPGYEFPLGGDGWVPEGTTL
ncbi:helix-turn-helix domain-containing protein [Streptomyces sp. NBC_01255]|uniref:helix-turn-helix domain-containing protein n=1 Tax=Streptomyces sp. NBC_01255 TaxID=2903798 RepID=UPI002E30E887|nr:helix-turn-helix transcriptional regulator [Streptomyces sp. NBC_01255]